MSKQDAAAPLRVAVVALPESTAYVLFGIKEALESVGPVWGMLTGEPGEGARFEVALVAATTTPFSCAGGALVPADTTFSGNRGFDIVIVTDLTIPPDTDVRGHWADAAGWIAERHAEGATIASVCSGSVLLAEAGLLNGCEATTHWAYAAGYAKAYPQVQWRPERILCIAGEDERLVTGGGAASWEDLVLWLVARFCGPPEAIRLAKTYVMGDRSEGQLLYAALRRPRRHEDAVIAECQEWLADHYREADVVGRLAAHSGLPVRSFGRRFREATGYAPLDYVQALRIEEAKELLETTDQSADAVGHAVGYEDPGFFRRLFKRRTGITPARYRQRFKGVGRAVT